VYSLTIFTVRLAEVLFDLPENQILGCVIDNKCHDSFIYTLTQFAVPTARRAYSKP